jgi:hypothetical protein
MLALLFALLFSSFAHAQDARNVSTDSVDEVTLERAWERADTAHYLAKKALRRAERSPNQGALEELEAAQAELQTALDALPDKIEASKQEVLEAVKIALDDLGRQLDDKFREIDARLNAVEKGVIVLRSDIDGKSGCHGMVGLFAGVDFHAPLKPAVNGVAWFTPGFSAGMACDAAKFGTTVEGQVSLLVPGSFNAGAHMSHYWLLPETKVPFALGVAYGGSYSGMGMHSGGYSASAFNVHVGPYGRVTVAPGLDLTIKPQARLAWPSLYYGARGFSIAGQVTAGVQYRF